MGEGEPFGLQGTANLMWSLAVMDVSGGGRGPAAPGTARHCQAQHSVCLDWIHSLCMTQ